jgi:predicted amidohydrolase
MAGSAQELEGVAQHDVAPTRKEGFISTVRIALANLRVPSTPDDSVALATAAVADAGRRGAAVICFPECFVPGYRWPGQEAPQPDTAFLQRAWTAVADAARRAGVAVILGTERVTDRGLQITACVINPDGVIAGWQDKGQIDPSEEGTYPAVGTERRLFRVGPLTFGVVICHEGWRYPETVRWAVRRGAQLVFHPHAHVAEPGSYRPVTFADPANTFHEKAMLCRAAENTCYFASVNCASEGSGTTSAVARPDGTLQCYQPYGHEGLLVADLDLSMATGVLASRCRTSPM